MSTNSANSTKSVDLSDLFDDREHSEQVPSPTAQADSATPVVAEILDPTTGELIPITDIDALIDAYERIQQLDQNLIAAKGCIRQALAGMTEGDTKTRRVQGRRRKAVLTMPDDSWDQSILKEAWNSYPTLRDQCLKIGTISVMAREYKKLVNTSGNPDLVTFRDMVSRANKGPQGLPTVKVEA